MKIERTRNATRNIIFGIISRIYQIVVPFIMRTLMIYFLGVQYLGLSSLFASILQVLNLAELGVGSAMVFSMYKPIAEDNPKEICALMWLYRLYYRIIGLVIAVIGCFLIPFIPKLINGSIPSDVNIYFLYILNLGATVLSYWLFAYKNCLFNAHQRIDILSKIKIYTDTIQYVLQVAALCIFKNYYIYLIVALATQALNNAVVAFVATKQYPEYRPFGKLEKSMVRSINKRIRDLFFSKVGTVVVNSADTIVISAFLGLTILAIYQNYFYILNSIKQFIAIILMACIAGIGNSIILESKEKIYEDFNELTFLLSWLTGFCTCCLLCLYQPFMRIWMGDELTLDFSAVICFCLYFYIYVISALFTTYKDAAGIWHQDRFRPIITAFVNLAMNLSVVKFWGIYGVLLSTVLSMLFIGIPWVLQNLFTYLFDRKYLITYLKKLLKYTVVSLFSCLVSLLICSLFEFDDYCNLIIGIIVCCIIPNVIFFVLFRKTREFSDAVQLIDRITKGKIKRYIKCNIKCI